MTIGKHAWYVVSLWEKAVSVVITSIELDKNGKHQWVVGMTKDGEIYKDYANKFTNKTPIQYHF